MEVWETIRLRCRRDGEKIKPVARELGIAPNTLRKYLRQDVPPKMESIDYEIVVDTDEPERRLELLHENVKKFGTVFNTIAPGTQLSGRLKRAS